ncbi:MAG: GAF domain-containing protein, partial [Anaerolineales bacterium]|nr:GAF domain-containing protein [Anaerolineales bacterium]
DRLTQRLTHEGWERFLGQTQAAGLAYVFDGEQAAPAPAGSPLLAEASQVVAQPLTVRGHVIGQVAAAPRSPEAAGDAAAADPELAVILAAVADGLSAHIDNLRLADQTQQALSQTEALYQLTARLNEARTLDEVVGVVAGVRDAAGTLLTVEADAQGQPAVLTGAAHWPAGVDTVGLAGARRPAAQFPAAQLWINAPDEPLLFEDLETDPRLDEASRAFNRQRGVRAAVYLPLRVGGAWVGLLVLAWPEPQRFSADEAQLYRALAAQAAVVVNNRLLFEQTRKRADREAVINAITQKIQGTATVQGALETALQELGQALRARRASVALAVAGAEAPAANGHDQPAAAGPAPR